MDQALVTFRQAAARENRARRGLQRRYSPALQQRAVEYWRRRRRAGDGVPFGRGGTRRRTLEFAPVDSRTQESGSVSSGAGDHARAALHRSPRCSIHSARRRS
jgi:hypothetical protein